MQTQGTSYSRRTKVAENLWKRHVPKGCPQGYDEKARCTCGDRVRYDARRWSAKHERHFNRTFEKVAEAKVWLGAAEQAIEAGERKANGSETVAEAARAFVAALKDGTALSRRHEPFAPKTRRGYIQALEAHFIPSARDGGIGNVKLGDVEPEDVQELVRQWQRDKLHASTIRNRYNALRALFREAVAAKKVKSNPCDGVRLPKVKRQKEITVTSPHDARALLAALDDDNDRAIFATASFAGLRCGELRALRCEDVDLDALEIHVRYGWDDVEGEKATKTDSGYRVVPILDELIPYLRGRGVEDRAPGDLVFGKGRTPFVPSSLGRRAKKAWEGKKGTRLHEARHTFASRLIASGASPLVIKEVMGHANIETTFKEYGHLFPNDLHDLRERANANIAAEIERADTETRLRQLAA